MRSWTGRVVAMLALVALTGCVPPGQRGPDPYRGTGMDGAGCATVQVDNRRWERAVVYQGMERVASIEGKMGGQFTLCRSGEVDLTVHFIGAGNLRPRVDGSVGPIGLVEQDLVLVIGLTDLQSYVRARD